MDIMLDLETMGVAPNAAIIAIGAVEFDVHAGVLGRKFYEVIDLQSAVDCGGTISPSTVLWWMRQDDDARKEFDRVGKHIAPVLSEFSKWFLKCEGLTCVWGNGANFDNVLLRSAYNRLNVPCPWAYWQDRCFRTVKAMYSTADNILPPMEGTKHNALDDARWQAQYLIELGKAEE